MTNPLMTPRGHMANLIAKSQSKRPMASGGVCPLMNKTLQLLPLRYGLVEDLAPPGRWPMPYTLQSHTMGFRLVRDGFLYVIDSSTGLLHEYTTALGSVSGLLFKGKMVTENRRTAVIEKDPALVFSREGVLHVTFSEVQWTAAKCTQVLDVAAEREHFMQRISFEQVDMDTAEHLITESNMRPWLAEASLSRAFEKSLDIAALKSPPPQTGYGWEHAPLYRQVIIEEFTSQICGDCKDDFLFVVLRDDIGVMRDLAQHQDQVVGEIEQWTLSGTEEGQVERDYLLAAYIESLTLISEADLNERAKAEPELKALLDDLEAMPEPQREQTRQHLLELINEKKSRQQLPDFNAPDAPADLQARLDNLPPDTGDHIHSGLERRHETYQQYYLEQKLVGTDPVFIARHRHPLWQLYRQYDKPTRDRLYGAKFGQRGINDLIDRPAMDAFLEQQRPQLQAWNDLLDKITADRVKLLGQSRFHHAAWYYDAADNEQIDQALLCQYACLKDICRSDSANEKVLAWLEQNPAMSRPLFYTLPLSVQTERAVQFAFITNAGWLAIKESPEWIRRLTEWSAGYLPDTATLSTATQVSVGAAWGTLAPALQNGMQQAFQSFVQDLDKGLMPELDELFRRLPKAGIAAIIAAARRERVSFQVGSKEDLDALSKLVVSVREKRKELSRLKNTAQQRRAWNKDWHKSDAAYWHGEEHKSVQKEVGLLEKQLAQSLSPIGGLPQDHILLQDASPGKPGLAVVFPPEHQAGMRSLLDNYRQGVEIAPKVGLVGDGVALLVFVAQMVNFLQVMREVESQPEDSKDLKAYWSSVAATAAAGFGAAQGIADTALAAQAAALAKNMDKAGLLGVHVQMGKLHVSLGIAGYGAGIFAAAMSLNSSHNNLQQALRSGNREAMAGAALSMLGNSGFVASNAYGAIESGLAFKHVLSTARRTPERAAAWALAGTRLSTVFMRFNLAGLILTALELTGSWFYNRHNLSLHDYWLLSTPWSQDPERRQSLPLKRYQKNLLKVIQAPRLEVLPETAKADSCLLLHFPTLTGVDLAESLGNTTSPAMIRIGGFQVIRTFVARAPVPERWIALDSRLQDRLYLWNDTPLSLELQDVAGLLNVTGPDQCDLVLALDIGYRRDDGLFESNRYDLRFPASGASGTYPSRYLAFPDEPFDYFRIDPAMLSKAER